jgi:hypothetical protein
VKKRATAAGILLSMVALASCQQSQLDGLEDQLAVAQSVPYAQVEIGGPYAGIECHHSSPLLNRISFYYPVANSIDLSEDYWRRDLWRVLYLAIRRGSDPPEIVGLRPMAHRLTPYSVTYSAEQAGYRISVTYGFCKELPAFAITIRLTNLLSHSETFELRTHLEASLRTCHSYRWERAARVEFWQEEATASVTNLSPATGPAVLFVSNVAQKPNGVALDGRELDHSPSDHPPHWLTRTTALPQAAASHETQSPVVAFTYRRQLRPGREMAITQLIGTCRPEEAHQVVRRLRRSWREQLAAHRVSVLRKAFLQCPTAVEDTVLAHAIHWAKAILETNLHYLDGTILPMPCPAEYNFFFTHDALMTDLSTCVFDVERVRRDLLFLARHADSANTLPHAYYWRDDGYITEFASADNWNHAWLILTSGRYLRHSDDRETLRKLFPVLRKSLQLALTRVEEDDLIWAARPDWWDIGDVYGPRAYLTSLVCAAVREYTALAFALQEKDSLLSLERLADRMEHALGECLWDPERRFLVDRFADGTRETHLYAGALLAGHLGLLDEAKLRAMLHTARSCLVDSALGVRNAWPADFHLLVERYRFHGNEAGPPYRYLNGGVWPHGNAWFCLLLDRVGDRRRALELLSRWAAVRNVLASPGGQAAMFEYRVADKADSLGYGRVDKPQFTWAAGWFLYALYWLYGIRENAWNIYLDPLLPDGQQSFEARIWIRGQPVEVRLDGKGSWAEAIRFDGTPQNTLVLPSAGAVPAAIGVTLGHLREPYLARTTAAVGSVRFSPGPSPQMTLCLIAFPGHRSETLIHSPYPAREVHCGDSAIPSWRNEPFRDGFRILIQHVHHTELDTLVVRF